MTALRRNAACSLLLGAVACAGPRPLALDEPAPAAPERPAVAEHPEAAPRPPDVVPPRLVRGERLLASVIETPDGAPRGTVDDLLIAPSGREIAGVLVARPDAGDEGGRSILPFAALDWTSMGSGTAVVVLAPEPEEGSVQSGDYTDLFDARSVSSITGEIVELESQDPPVGHSLVLKVRDEGNLLHRILVEPANLVVRCLTTLSTGRTVAAQGMLTRDTTGKLLIASKVTQDGTTLTLRNPSGAIRWEAIARLFQSARGIPGTAVVTEDGVSFRVNGWILDVDAGAAAYLCIDVDGVDRVLPWPGVPLDPEGRWRIALESSVLGLLPDVSSGESLGDLP